MKQGNTLRTLLLAALFAGSTAVSLEASAQVTVTNAWARGTVTGQTSTGAYMLLQSAGDAVLKSATSPLGKVEIHEMRVDGNVMRMRAIPQLPLPAGKSVELAPGGYHIMLTGLKKPIAAGEKLPIKLRIEGKDGKAQDVDVQAEVRPLNASAGNGGSANTAAKGGQSGHGPGSDHKH